MARQRTDAEQQIAELLRTARRSLHMSVAFLSRLDGTTQHLEVVESSVPLLFQEGVTQVQKTSLCQAILDRKLPPVIPDSRRNPITRELDAAVIAPRGDVALVPGGTLFAPDGWLEYAAEGEPRPSGRRGRAARGGPSRRWPGAPCVPGRRTR